MKIIFRQHIFLHHLLYPSNITSCKKLLFLGWTQPPCGYLTAFDRSQSSEPGYSTDGTVCLKLSHQQEETKSWSVGATCPSPVQWLNMDWLGVPSADGPTSKSKAVDLESSFPLSASAVRGQGPLCLRNPCEEGRQLFLQMLGGFQSCERLDFLFYFLWQDFWLWERKTHFKGLFEKL